jgi:hypothetical protein
MIDEFRERWDEDQEEEARERRERKLGWGRRTTQAVGTRGL